jgi:hypothetical protein
VALPDWIAHYFGEPEWRNHSDDADELYTQADPRVAETTYQCDHLDRLEATTRAVDVTTYVTTTYQFDHLNRRTKVIQPAPAGDTGPGPTIPRTITSHRVGQ